MKKTDTENLIIAIKKLRDSTIESTTKKKLPHDITHVYHPLLYGWEAHEEYLRTYANFRIKAILIGINPGPFGMCQTSVPFGEINAVKNFLQLKKINLITSPKQVHPKRPIEGYQCKRSEVSGKRLWAWASENFFSAETFFQNYFLWNLCPAAFLHSSGRNITPDKLPRKLSTELVQHGLHCIENIINILQPEKLVGIGRWSSNILSKSFSKDIPVHFLLHPSPASPVANKGWKKEAIKQLKKSRLPTSAK